MFINLSFGRPPSPRYLVLNDVLVAASMLLSPLVGLHRYTGFPAILLAIAGLQIHFAERRLRLDSSEQTNALRKRVKAQMTPIIYLLMAGILTSFEILLFAEPRSRVLGFLLHSIVLCLFGLAAYTTYRNVRVSLRALRD